MVVTWGTAFSALPTVQKTVHPSSVCSTSSAFVRFTSTAVPAGVMAQMTLLFEFKFSPGALHNTTTTVKESCSRAADAVIHLRSSALLTGCFTQLTFLRTIKIFIILADCSHYADTRVEVIAIWADRTVSVSLTTAIQTAGITSFAAFVSTFSRVIKVVTSTAGLHTPSIFHKIALCAVYTCIYSTTCTCCT